MKKILTYLFFLSIAIWFVSCKQENTNTNSSKLVKDYSNDVAVRWHKLIADIDRYSAGYRPPAAARMFAYVGLAAYESAVPGMPEYKSLKNQWSGLSIPAIQSNSEYHWPTCVNAAYSRILQEFYKNVKADDKQKIIALEAALNSDYQASVSADVFTRSKEFGKSVADAVWTWSTTDVAGHEAYLDPQPTSYVPPVGTGLWAPTKPDFGKGLFPYWGNVRAFAVQAADKIAKAPIPYSTDPNSPFYNQGKEIQVMVKNITYENRWLAEFWSDDIFQFTFEPAARMDIEATQMAVNENIALDRTLELYAKMGMALCDVGICVWNSKYLYNVVRPIDYINNVFGDASWKTILNNPISGDVGITPPFPAYPSGHSGFGGAGGSVLMDIFGANTSFTDLCHQGRTEFNSTPRHFNNFIEMANEDAYSRLPLGVHFRMDCDEGLRLGYLAAHRVLDLPWKN